MIEGIVRKRHSKLIRDSHSIERLRDNQKKKNIVNREKYDENTDENR